MVTIQSETKIVKNIQTVECKKDKEGRLYIEAIGSRYRKLSFYMDGIEIAKRAMETIKDCIRTSIRYEVAKFKYHVVITLDERGSIINLEEFV